MATDAVTIANQALGHLGDLTKNIHRMTTFSRAGCQLPIHHVVIDFYDAAKEQMHAMLDWKRTRKVKALTVSADAPVLDGKWSYKYDRPPGCLIFRHVMDTSGNRYEYDEVNEANSAGQLVEYIYTNQADAIGWWTVLIGEERYMPGMAELHSLILAQKLAMSVTGKAEVRLAFARELEGRAERLCKAMGSKEGYVENETGSREYTDLY